MVTSLRNHEGSGELLVLDEMDQPFREGGSGVSCLYGFIKGFDYQFATGCLVI